MPLELRVFEASLRRKAHLLLDYLFKVDPEEDRDPIHMAHRSLVEEHRRRVEEAAARAAEEGEGRGSRKSQDALSVLAAELQEEREQGRPPPVGEYEDSWWTKIFLLLDEPNFSTKSKYMSIFLCAVVILSCVSYLMGTMNKFKYFPEQCKNPICVPGPDAPCTHTVCFPQPRPAIYYIEVFAMLVFTVDYLVRVACVHAVPYRLIHPECFVKGYLADHLEPNGLTKTVSYLFSFLNIVDLCAILPFYIHFLVKDMRANLVFLRLLRLLRVVRVFKLGRYSEGHAILQETLLASVPALLIMCFFMLVVTVLFGALIFYCEEGTFKVTEEYPEGAYFRPANAGGEEVSPFKNIPAACYWVVMTATTVGYGDFYPSTTAGRFIAVVVAYSGIVSIALPVTIIGKHFNDVYFEFREKVMLKRAAEAAAAAKLKEKEDGQHEASAPSSSSSSSLLVNEEALTAAIQRQLSSLAAPKPSSPLFLPAATAAAAAAEAAAAAAAAAEVLAPPATAGAGAGAAPPAAAAVPSEPAVSSMQNGTDADGGGGLRRRAALTGVIREQLVQMDATMRTLAARLEELEKLPQ